MFWWLLLIVIVLVVLLHVFIPRVYMGHRVMSSISKVQGPAGIPYFGNIFQFMVKNDEFIPCLINFMEQYKPIWKCTFLGRPFLFLSDLEDVQIILNSQSHITKGIDYAFLIPWFGNGLLLSTGNTWFHHRKLLTPTFHFAILEQYIDVMNRNAEVLCNIIATHKEGDPIEINPLICYCALDIICETTMGAQVNAQLGGEKAYVSSILRMGQIFTERTLTPWYYRPFLFDLFPIGREQKRLLKIIHDFGDKVIKERKLAYKKDQELKNSQDAEAIELGRKKKRSFLDLLIEISETESNLTEVDMRDEVNNFLFAGHDTTANALIWTLFEIGLNPSVQEKIFEELDEIFSGTNRVPNSTDLTQMKYLEMVIKEGLRLYPSVPLISRVLEEDVKIREYLIPAGTEIPIFIYYLHRKPDIFPEPEKFNPDRFTSDFLRDRHPFSYVPFSAGPRNCIGQRFAMMEMKIVLSHILRKYKVTTVDKREDIKVIGEIILRSNKNIKMKFEKRKINN